MCFVAQKLDCSWGNTDHTNKYEQNNETCTLPTIIPFMLPKTLATNVTCKTVQCKIVYQKGVNKLFLFCPSDQLFSNLYD